MVTGKGSFGKTGPDDLESVADFRAYLTAQAEVTVRLEENGKQVTACAATCLPSSGGNRAEAGQSGGRYRHDSLRPL